MQIPWQNRPPAPTEFAGVRLYRVPPGKSVEAIITCEHMIGAVTHFAHRRTQPCTGPDCSLCIDGVPGRWHGYLSVWSTRNRTQHVLELTALAAFPVAKYDDRQSSLRGATINASRMGNRPNSPVTCSIAPTDLDLRTLPRAINLERFLMTLWSMREKSQDGEEKPPPGQNIRNTVRADPPTCTTGLLKSIGHPDVIEAAKSNGKGQK